MLGATLCRSSPRQQALLSTRTSSQPPKQGWHAPSSGWAVAPTATYRRCGSSKASAPTGHALRPRPLSRDISLSKHHGWTLAGTAALANQILWTLVALLLQPSPSSLIDFAIPVRTRAFALHSECWSPPVTR